MLEVRLLHHGRFVDVKSERDAVVVRDFHQLFHVFDVRAADIRIKKDGVAVTILAPHQVVEVGTHVFERFRQARLFLDGIHGEVDGGNARVSEAINHIRTQQARVGGEINPKIFFRRVVDDFVHKIWAHQRLAASGSQHAARRVMQPINGATGGVFGHALDAIVVGPTVVAIQIAFPLGEKIRNDRLKIARHNARFEIGNHPAAHVLENTRRRPVPSCRCAALDRARRHRQRPARGKVRVAMGNTGVGSVFFSLDDSGVCFSGDSCSSLCSGTSRRKG